MYTGLGCQSSVRPTTSCICPGYEATFECVLTGGTSTAWQGTALEECTNREIILRHSQFTSGHVRNETCGSELKISGQVISVESELDNITYYYTSRLTINNITQHLNGSTIECFCYQQFPNSSQANIQLTTGISLASVFLLE